jgi:hypothetical protein
VGLGLVVVTRRGANPSFKYLLLALFLEDCSAKGKVGRVMGTVVDVQFGA